MTTKKQVNKVLLRCKGGAHQKDKKYKLSEQRTREFKQVLRKLDI